MLHIEIYCRTAPEIGTIAWVFLKQLNNIKVDEGKNNILTVPDRIKANGKEKNKKKKKDKKIRSYIYH